MARLRRLADSILPRQRRLRTYLMHALNRALLACIVATAAWSGTGVAATTVTFSGRVVRGETFSHPITAKLTFLLVPDKYGWQIEVREAGRPNENLTRLTPPYHFVPNPRFLEGWHFRNADNTGPNEIGPKNVNAPGKKRGFIFSTLVGRDQVLDDTSNPEFLLLLSSFSKGLLTIKSMTLGNLVANQRAWFKSLSFSVVIDLETAPARSAASPPPSSQLRMIDREHGWARGESAIFRTEDGGQTWKQVLRASTCATFLDVQTAWAAILLPSLGEVDVYRTSDGGASWVKGSFATRDFDVACSLTLPDGRHGWLTLMPIHDAGAQSGELYRTLDGGVSWHLIVLRQGGP